MQLFSELGNPSYDRRTSSAAKLRDAFEEKDIVRLKDLFAIRRDIKTVAHPRTAKPFKRAKLVAPYQEHRARIHGAFELNGFSKIYKTSSLSAREPISHTGDAK